MKKALSIILIVVALTNIVGFMPLYFSLLQEVKSEACLKMAKSEELKKVLVSDTEYNNPDVFSVTDEHEFKYKGQLYDYSSVKKISNGFVFFALQDNKEAELADFLTAVFGQDNTGKNAKAPLGNLLKNFSKDFVAGSSDIHAVRVSFKVYYPYAEYGYTCAGHSGPIATPPDAVC